MPTFELSTGAPADIEAGMLAIGATKAAGDDAPPVLDAAGAALAERLDLDLAALAAATGFDGSAGTVARIPTRGALPATMLLVAGLGDADRVDAEAVRRAAAAAAGAASRTERLATTLALTAGVAPDAAARAVVEGVTLGGYEFRSYKTDESRTTLGTVVLAVADEQAAQAGVDLGLISAEATTLVRDLVNTAPQDKRPPALAERVGELVADLPITVTVLDEAALIAGGYGGHLGVGAGSEAESRFVELAYRPDGAASHVALVGKGITFDSGGLSLKPPKSMETMKSDMGGAATVLAAVRAAAQLALPVAVTGLLCLAENMPSGSATRPGDVLTMKGGTTVEVLNTDAEGRLVLADGLVRAGELDPKPDLVIDIATLTGAVIHAVGPRYTGVIGEDDALVADLLAAAAAAAEPMWRLPLAVDEYDEDLKSAVADIQNIGGTGAGSTRAALFLRRFRPDGIPWAHLDIAGSAFNETAAFGYVGKGGTGIPARTMIEFLRTR